MADVIFKQPSVSRNALSSCAATNHFSSRDLEQCAVTIHQVEVSRGILKKPSGQQSQNHKNKAHKKARFANLPTPSSNVYSFPSRKKVTKVDPSHFKSKLWREKCLISEGSARMSAVQLANGRGLLEDPDDRELWEGSAVSANEDRRLPMIWLKDRVLRYTGTASKTAWYASFTSEVPFQTMCREVAVGHHPGEVFQRIGDVPEEGEKGVCLLNIPVRNPSVGIVDKVAASPRTGRASAARKARRRKSNVKIWLVDSGCGHDLISKREVRESNLDQESCETPVGFNTANGSTVAHNVAPLYIDELDCNIAPYVLPSTPAVVSMGKRCGHEGYSFIWMSGKCPYFITPDKKRIRLRVAGDIPYLVPGDPFCAPVDFANLSAAEQSSMPVVESSPF